MPLFNPSSGSGAPADADYLVGTANGTLSAEIVVGTSPGGELGGTWASPTVDATHSGSAHVTLGTTPSTQAMGDAAAGGADSTSSKNDHKHAMPTLGFGLTNNSTPAVSLTTASAYITAETTISAATYADITGANISLAAGTWLILATVNGSSQTTTVTAMFVAITHSDNTVISETSQHIVAGTATVRTWGNANLSAIVTPGSTTTYKLRGARGTTTQTGNWIASDGNGVNTANNVSNNSDKGTSIRAVRIA